MFVFIQLLKINNEYSNEDVNEIINAGMESNFYANENYDNEDVIQLKELTESVCRWENFDPEILTTLPIGTMFKGCDQNSLMRNYIIIKKDDDDVPYWYPIDNEIDIVVRCEAFNEGENKWDVIAIGTEENVENYLSENLKENTLYRFTDIMGNTYPVSFFDCDEDDNALYYTLSETIIHDDHKHQNIKFVPVTNLLTNLENAKAFALSYKRMFNATSTTETEKMNLEENIDTGKSSKTLRKDFIC